MSDSTPRSPKSAVSTYYLLTYVLSYLLTQCRDGRAAHTRRKPSPGEG